VRAALEAGEVSRARWESYLKLRAEEGMPMMRSTVSGLMVIVMVLGATPDRVVASGATFAVVQRADTVVRQAGRPLYPSGGTLVAERSIGVVDGAQEYMFGSVRDILELRDGSVLVVDAQAPALRHYDAKGVHLRTIGRRGQGPGEYTRPGTIAELRDGRILLIDAGSSRVNVYSHVGESVDTWKLAVPGGVVSASRITVDTTGTVVVTAYASGGGLAAGGRFLRFAPDGRVIDTVSTPDFGYTRPTASSTTRAGTVVAVLPFFPLQVSVWSPLGYMVSGLPTRYAVDLRIPAGRRLSTAAIPAMRYAGPTAQWRPGDPIVSIRHTVPPVPVSDEQRSVEVANAEAIIRQIDPTWRYTGPEIPRVKAPYRDVRVGDDGTIWVQLSMPGVRSMPDPPAPGEPVAGPLLPRWREPGIYDVFEPSGRYLGRITRPTNVSLTRLSRDHVWGTLADDDDVVVVKRFRIDWR
jgi:hypothetical protein